MNLKDMVVPNKDFQTSINIEFDFGSKEKIEGLIPTDSVCRYLERILGDVIAPSNQRAKLLVGAYGKGKSHVVLAALMAMWCKDPGAFQRITNAYRRRNSGFAETFDRFVQDGQRLLPVVISGSTSDLRHSLLFALRNALKLCDSTDLMPSTNYDGAIRVLDRWRRDYPSTLKRYEELTGSTYGTTVAKLRALETETYEEFVAAYPSLTSGSTFDVLDGADVLSVYEQVLSGLAERGVSGLYVVYDEFSKYLETSIGRATVEDTRLLQDFAEACNRSGAEKQLHLLLISHKSISNYIDADLPKEKVDGWRGVSGRFEEIEMSDDENQSYELMSSAIIKDSTKWSRWRCDHEALLSRIEGRYVHNGLFAGNMSDVVVRGCYPLHPLTAFLLPKLSEKVAQNERTLFTFLCAEGDKTMSAVLAESAEFVTPDCIYDYFEPLLRKEMYTSPLHRVYELARASLSRVEPVSLEARIIKTVAAIDAVAQYDRVEPTKETLLDLFCDCGLGAKEVDEAITRLVEGDSIVYLRRSNAYLKLKETTGVHVDAEVSNRAGSLRSMMSCEAALNREIGNMALYPSRYNEDKGMVRFFECGFVGASSLKKWCEQEVRPDHILDTGNDWVADGQVVGVYCSTPDELVELKDLAKNELSREKLTVAVVPRSFTRIEEALYRLEAARQLKEEAADDAALADEYEIVIEDYSEIVNGYIAGFFQPELRQSLYYVNGSQKKVVTRKRKLSEELSLLCDEVFGSTPRITSESLNKNDLTGTAFSSRTKILKALCAPTLAQNLGFVGNGQETSMARSAFEKTGLIKDIAKAINEPGVPESGIEAVIDTIKDFIETADNTPFSELYDKLMGRDLGIGLRMGPIPLYLAYVLRGYREQIKITFNGEERPLNETLFDDIAKNPSDYRLTRLNWSPEMETYVKKVAGVFGCKSDRATRADVVDAMRLWYVALPQMTRNANIDRSHGGAEPISRVRKRFFKAIKKIDCDTDKLLFEEIPSIFGEPCDSDALIYALKNEKEECDGYLRDCVKGLSHALMALFGPDAHEDASLSSVLRDWVDAHPAVQTSVYSGINNQVLQAVATSTGDDFVTINRIAKAATALRIDDWNDERFDDFLRIVQGMKTEVESTLDESGSTEDDSACLSIRFADERGVLREKTFPVVIPSRRAKLLKTGLLACLDEMGGALSPEEKRQVVFDVLRRLC